jgi:hypothetical protein
MNLFFGLYGFNKFFCRFYVDMCYSTLTQLNISYVINFDMVENILIRFLWSKI